MRDGHFRVIKLHDIFGDITLLSFSSIHQNPTLPADKFKFSAWG
ncbi:hypothetical protein [Candidatus Vallotia lariciata]